MSAMLKNQRFNRINAGQYDLDQRIDSKGRRSKSLSNQEDQDLETNEFDSEIQEVLLGNLDRVQGIILLEIQLD